MTKAREDQRASVRRQKPQRECNKRKKVRARYSRRELRMIFEVIFQDLALEKKISDMFRGFFGGVETYSDKKKDF